MQGRGKVKGLASIDAPVGSIVMYSTKSGDVAMDGTGKNSPFTSALIKHIKTPGLDVNLLPSRVTKTVLELTNNRQTPGTYVQLTESFSFVPEYTASELAKLKKQQEGQLTELQKKQAEMDRQKEQEDAELARQQAELDALEQQIQEMKQQTADGGGDLDKMLAIVEKKEKQKEELEAKRKRIAAEQKARAEKLYAMKKKDFEENIAKYNKIANSEFGKNMKEAAWNSLLKKFNIPVGSIAVGNKYMLRCKVFGLPLLEMVYIPGGTFQMGSKKGYIGEQPVHSVTVSSFYMAKYEVTVAEFEGFIDASGYKTDAEKGGLSYFWDGRRWERKSGVNWKCDEKGNIRSQSEYNHPVIHVSWNDAIAYCKWLSQETGKNYRLPTEAEWEYAAGNGVKHTEYSWGDGMPSGKRGGNVSDETAKKIFSDRAIFDGYSDGYVYTASVGQFNPNNFGLYDISGNVWEWCSDWYDSYYYSNSSDINPKGPSSGSLRVLRGGSWNSSPRICRVAYRSRYSPTYSNSNIGFRVALR